MIILEKTTASGLLVPARLAQALVQLAKGPGKTPRGSMHGQELRLGLTLEPNDAAAAAFMLDIVGQGRRVTAAANGPSAALLAWAFHALATSLKCTLLDGEGESAIVPAPDDHREAAIAYLTAYESEVHAARRGEEEERGADLLAWLAREGHLLLAQKGAVDIDELLDQPAALYELLLESDAIDDVFVSERELGWLVARYRARYVAFRRPFGSGQE
jgi:hypothetical protein